MEAKPPVSDKEKLVINALTLLGAILYFVLRCFPGLPLAGPDLIIKELAFYLLFIVQLARGLITQLRPAWLPRLLLLTRMDRRLCADCTVTFIVLFFVLELTVRGSIAPGAKLLDPTLNWTLFAVQSLLTLWLLLVCSKKNSANPGAALLAVSIMSLVFLSPILIACLIAFVIYKFTGMHTPRDYEILAAATVMPMMISVFILFLKDKRDRLKNTQRVIINQFVALPVIPLFYFLLRSFWPEGVSVMIVPIIPLLLITVPTLLARRERPWLVKERVEGLLARTAQNKELLALPTAEMETDILAIKSDLAEKRLILRQADDHIDRADAFWKLGDLQVNMSRLDDAQDSYNEAVKTYNRALEMDQGNQTALAHKFKTVEALSVAQRIKLQREQ